MKKNKKSTCMFKKAAFWGYKKVNKVYLFVEKQIT
jgi:hypothetical protein